MKTVKKTLDAIRPQYAKADIPRGPVPRILAVPLKPGPNGWAPNGALVVRRFGIQYEMLLYR